MTESLSKRKTLPDIEVLRQLFTYNPETGNLYWNARIAKSENDERSVNSFNTQFAGQKAGSTIVRPNGTYVQVYFRPHGSIFAHRVIWKLYYNEEPPDVIDHKDCDGTNNKINNLRRASIHQNGWNCKKNSRNKSGFKGVSFNSERKKWRAAIHIQGKTRLLGYYSTPEEAGEAYKMASVELHGDFYRV